MNRRSITLAVLAVSVLVLTALPGTAAAGEFIGHCESGATCTATTEATGIMELESISGERVTCTSMTGVSSFTSGGSTGTIQIRFAGCKESVFNLSCTSAGQAAGTITTNVMTVHGIYLEPNKTTPGVAVTGINVTLSCGGIIFKTITGNLMGHIENPECGKFVSHHTVAFEKSATGQPKFKQITTAGAINDLIMNNDNGGAYQTVAIVGTSHFTYPAANKVTLTC